MSLKRQMKRNEIKEFLGNNRIRNEWRRDQIKRYGFKKWWNMRVNCDPKKRSASTLMYGHASRNKVPYTAKSRVPASVVRARLSLWQKIKRSFAGIKAVVNACVRKIEKAFA